MTNLKLPNAITPIFAVIPILLSTFSFSASASAADATNPNIGNSACKIPKIVAQKAELDARYEIVKKKEKSAIEALGGAIGSSQAEKLKPNADNPYTRFAEMTIVGVSGALTIGSFFVGTALLIPASFGPLAALSIASGVGWANAPVFVATCVGMAEVNDFERSDAPGNEATERAIPQNDQMTVMVTYGSRTSNDFKQASEAIKSLPPKKQPSLMTLDEYINFQKLYLSRIDVAEERLDELAKVRRQGMLFPVTNETNKLIAKNNQQAAEAKRELLRREREAIANSRINLNLICETLMQKGAPTADPSAAEPAPIKKTGGSAD